MHSLSDCVSAFSATAVIVINYQRLDSLFDSHSLVGGFPRGKKKGKRETSTPLTKTQLRGTHMYNI